MSKSCLVYDNEENESWQKMTTLGCFYNLLWCQWIKMIFLTTFQVTILAQAKNNKAHFLVNFEKMYRLFLSIEGKLLKFFELLEKHWELSHTCYTQENTQEKWMIAVGACRSKHHKQEEFTDRKKTIKIWSAIKVGPGMVQMSSCQHRCECWWALLNNWTTCVPLGLRFLWVIPKVPVCTNF